MFIEDAIMKFIGAAKKKILMHIFNIPENTQNVHTNNYWMYVLKDHLGLDVVGEKPKLLGIDEFNGKMELGLQSFFEIFTPEWLISELTKSNK
ncbi:hypothetical protein NAPIS_ORF00492 [Vairimorpha apis BRL 01]|uniref:Uncharacterized protein n=1 Tax=Vairimorpha apis BRL 01 TaxID=1037528 RepID=T0MFT6_9MICR|nr:hypothetical protein NAPIS_ORF00492 [Vairimorpha apis BRL 01]